MAPEQDNGRMDDRPFGGRLRRYARVTTTMGGLAARVGCRVMARWRVFNMG